MSFDSRVPLVMGRIGLTAIACVVAAGCGYGAAPAAVTVAAGQHHANPAALGPVRAKVVAAGDIACDSPESKSGCRAADTAALTEGFNPDRVLVLGDLVYDAGTYAAFESGYAPTWGRFKARTFPTPGNHEYNDPGAAGYRKWWGNIATPQGTTWHATTLGGWRLIALDSNCGSVGGCGASSPQGRWLAAQLKNAPKCTLAIWHHPRRSSGPHGDNAAVQPLWSALAKARAEMVLVGHDHDYERFAAMDPSAHPASSGMREFVVGTGGKTFYPLGARRPGSVASVQGMAGVLRLSLRTVGYGWQFVTTDGVVRDSGSAPCR